MADLKPGTHQLRFASPVDDERWSEALVNVGDRPKVVRHAIGRTESPSAGNLAAVLLTLGASAVIIGGSLYGAGMLVSTERGQPERTQAS